MITYWVQATQENATLLVSTVFASNFISEEEGVLVVNQEGTHREVAGPFSDIMASVITRDIPEYKYHEKTKQFIPANSKLFEEEKQEKSVVKEDFKVEVGGSATISSDYKDQRYSGKEVMVLATFTYEDERCAVVAGELGYIIIAQDRLLPPLSEHEKRVKRFIAQYKPVFQRMKSDLGVTHKDLAEFLLSKQTNK